MQKSLAMRDSIFVDWIKKGLLAPGKSKGGLAKALGIHPSQISRLLTGHRQLKAEEVPLVARYLGVPPPSHEDAPFDVDLPFEESPASKISDSAPAGIPVSGAVAAGHWLELDAVVDESRFSPLPIGPSREFSPRAQYGLVVRGTSINRIATPGDILLCVDCAETGLEPDQGDLVIVQRLRVQEAQRELTAKRIRRRGNRIELHPDSDDPTWQKPIVLNRSKATEGEEIAIKAVVFAVYRPISSSQ